MNTTPLRVWPWLVVATLLTGCASASMTPAAAQNDGADAWVIADGGGKGDNQGSATGFDSAKTTADAATGESVGAAPDSGGIHLKPGGAQNTALFHLRIAQGEVPLPGELDIQGWLNEHGTHLPAAAVDQPIDLHALAALHSTVKNAPADVVIQIGFNTAQTLAQLQPPLAVVVAVDHSGSMAGEAIAQVRKATLRVFDSLPAGSQFGLVAFADDVCACWPLTVAAADQRAAVEEKLQGLEAKGGTNLHAGLTEALKQLDAAPVGATRIVLVVSDGGPTVGPGASAILALAQAHAGVHLGAVAVGPGADVALLKKLAEATQGSWLAAPDVADIESVVLGRLQSLLQATPTETGVFVGVPADPTPASGQNDADKLAVLYAAQDDGIVLARLKAPGNPDIFALADLQMATVQWSYRLSKEGPSGPLHTGTRKVMAPGLTQIPDDGIAYYESPIVRRAYALLHVAEVAQAALVLWQEQKHPEALAMLEDLLAYTDAEASALGADDYDHSLQDAYQLMEQLKANLVAHGP
jgi:Mg-chelatase subunit ChlD